MKLTAPAPALKSALARIGKIIAARSAIPILETVLVTVGDEITITASDMEITACVAVDGVALAHGAACIPAAELTRLATLAKTATVSLELSGGVAKISFGRSSAALKCMPAEDYPLADFPDDLPAVDGALFAAALQFVAPAASTEETRYYLNGAHVETRDGSTFIVCTDGHRLHVADMRGCDFGADGIIPNKAVPLIAAAAPSRLKITQSGWALSSDGLRMKGPVIDGTFPDWRKIAPGVKSERCATVSAADFSSAIEIASVGLDGKTERAVLIDVAGGRISVTGEAAAGKMAQAAGTEVDADVIGDAFKCISSPYLLAAIAATGAERVALDESDFALDVAPADQREDLVLSARIVMRRTSAQRQAA